MTSTALSALFLSILGVTTRLLLGRNTQPRVTLSQIRGLLVGMLDQMMNLLSLVSQLKTTQNAQTLKVLLELVINWHSRWAQRITCYSCTYLDSHNLQLLELSGSCTPEVSQYKLASVLAYDHAAKKLTVKYLGHSGTSIDNSEY